MRKSGFTLVELLIGVAISAIIMTGVMLFVGSGIENAFKVRKGVEENRASIEFDAALGQLVSFGGELVYTGVFNPPYGTGFLLKNPNLPTPLVVLATKSITGVCDSYSGVMSDPIGLTRLVLMKAYSATGATNTGAVFGAGGDLMVDSANDRVLLSNWGTTSTFLEGLRHPREILATGSTIYIADDTGILVISGTTAGNPVSFSGGFLADKDFSFDTVEISLPSEAVVPGDTAEYVFDFVLPDQTVLASGNTGTVSFSGGTHTYSRGDSAQIRIAGGITAPPALPGAYQATVRYLLAWIQQYERVLPYIVIGDGNPLTLENNAFSRIDADFPFDLSWAGTLNHSVLPTAAHADIPNIIDPETTLLSPRIIENLQLSSDSDILTLSFLEYIRFDCLNGQHSKRERVFKIPIHP